MQVAPNVWVTTLPTRLPRLSSSQAVPHRSRFQEEGQALPDQVDLRTAGYDGPMKNQQMVGVCWTFALSTVMDNALRRAGRQEVMAPLHILSSKVMDELWRDGHSNDLVTEPSWPYDPPKACKLNESKSEIWCEEAYHVRHGSWRDDAQLVAEVERAKQNGVFRISKVEHIKTDPLDTNQLASILATGQAIYLGMNIDTQVWKRPQQGVLGSWSSSDGGHAVVAIGYRTTGGTRQFLIHNSWGTTWADGGYAWISDAMMRQWTDDAITLEVVGPHGQPLPSSTKMPPPGQQKPTGGSGGFPLPLPWPFPQPGGGDGQPQPGGRSAGGCGAAQVRDLVFGTCSAPCAGGGPPTAGLCPFSSRPTGGGQAPQQQPPPQQGCPAGTVKDLVTNQCSPQCSNGMPPAAGMCAPWGR